MAEQLVEIAGAQRLVAMVVEAEAPETKLGEPTPTKT